MGAFLKIKKTSTSINSNPVLLFLYYFVGLLAGFYILKLLNIYDRTFIYILFQSLMIAAAILLLNLFLMNRPNLRTGQKILRLFMILLITVLIIVPLFRFLYFWIT